ncbi:MAG TPA: hypothetical protein VJA40_03470 [archaeon]|nr:hypothetical protein [archaeon]
MPEEFPKIEFVRRAFLREPIEAAPEAREAVEEDFEFFIERVSSAIPGYAGYQDAVTSRQSSNAFYSTLSREFTELLAFFKQEPLNGQMRELTELLQNVVVKINALHSSSQFFPKQNFVKEAYENDLRLVNLSSNILASQFTPLEFLERGLDSLKAELQVFSRQLDARRSFFA